ncbi:nuclear transport factor 2 family protein [Simiduia aestuariiviva]|uniref:DUF4440 domain-containing protein n=1 Tax=Simiduia aestuariiviva TaxID=1510459 RepID=A0A839UP50_9GAMM|nr:nuclear transport factor 2 family protein [Simiduia aestuariiviva]MBB3167526.1 hypothetical protein [Simiduia aestuariiviva]
MKILTSCLLLCMLALPAHADDRADLTQMLHTFLQGASDDIEQHQRFWADDLVYTSSSGQRFGKAKILAGMQDTPATEQQTKSRYWAEDIEIKLYGTTAIIAFRLMGEMTEGEQVRVQQYFNTGTFLKREGRWQAVAWQATKIPE